MLKCFPLAYTTDYNDKNVSRDGNKPPSFNNLVHISQAHGFNNKTQYCDYFSCTPQLIFDQFVTEQDRMEGLKGYYGLPEAREVAQDLIA